MDRPRRIVVFRYRAFVSLLTGLSFLIMSVSGIILYLAPSGRRAAEQDWSLWALSRSQWLGLHLSFSALFVIIAAIHLWLNRKPLIKYLNIKVKAVRGLRWEWLAVLVVGGLMVWGTFKPFEPFTTLLDQRERFHRASSPPQENAPAEQVGMRQLTLEAYCRQHDLDPDAVLEKLRDHGIFAEKTDTLYAIAEANNIRPGPLRRLIESDLP